MVVALDLELAVLIGEAVRAGQLEHVFEDRALVRDVLVGKVERNHVLVQFFLEIRVGEKALDLAAEQELAVFPIIVERLDAEDIARAEKLLCLLIPDDEREHAAQAVENLFAVFLVAVEDDLAVRLCRKDVAGFQKLLADRLVVIDLAVKEQDEAAVLIENRLAAALKVNDRKAAEAKGDAVVHVVVGVVGAAVNDPVRHGLDDLHFIECGVVVDIACKAAHTEGLLFRGWVISKGNHRRA